MEEPQLRKCDGSEKQIDGMVLELKSQGIFDQFRKECFSDVDTKPAYQNLQSRLEASVDGFLRGQIWSPDLNKNQLRDSLRKHILDSSWMAAGIERIVEQVVNPKISSVFLPRIEEMVYSYFGVEKPRPEFEEATPNPRLQRREPAAPEKIEVKEEKIPDMEKVMSDADYVLSTQEGIISPSEGNQRISEKDQSSSGKSSQRETDMDWTSGSSDAVFTEEDLTRTCIETSVEGTSKEDPDRCTPLSGAGFQGSSETEGNDTSSSAEVGSVQKIPKSLESTSRSNVTTESKDQVKVETIKEGHDQCKEEDDDGEKFASFESLKHFKIPKKVKSGTEDTKLSQGSKKQDKKKESAEDDHYQHKSGSSSHKGDKPDKDPSGGNSSFPTGQKGQKKGDSHSSSRTSSSSKGNSSSGKNSNSKKSSSKSYSRILEGLLPKENVCQVLDSLLQHEDNISVSSVDSSDLSDLEDPYDPFHHEGEYTVMVRNGVATKFSVTLVKTKEELEKEGIQQAKQRTVEKPSDSLSAPTPGKVQKESQFHESVFSLDHTPLLSPESLDDDRNTPSGTQYHLMKDELLKDCKVNHRKRKSCSVENGKTFFPTNGSAFGYCNGPQKRADSFVHGSKDSERDHPIYNGSVGCSPKNSVMQSGVKQSFSFL